MYRFNKDLINEILNYLSLKDRYKTGLLNKRFNKLWNNYILPNTRKITNHYYYDKYMFTLPKKIENAFPYIGILNKCKREIVKFECKFEYIYLSHEERLQFYLQSNTLI